MNLGNKSANLKGRIHPQGSLILLIGDQLPNIKIIPRTCDIGQALWMQKGPTCFLFKATQHASFMSHIDFFSPNRMAILPDELPSEQKRCDLREMGRKLHSLHLFAPAKKLRKCGCSRPGDKAPTHDENYQSGRGLTLMAQREKEELYKADLEFTKSSY